MPGLPRSHGGSRWAHALDDRHERSRVCEERSSHPMPAIQESARAARASYLAAHDQRRRESQHFIATAFASKLTDLQSEAITSIKPKTPSATLRSVRLQLNRNWIAAMGGKFQGDEGCGCRYLTNKWSGVIQYSFQESGDEWQSPLQDGSNRSLVNFVVNVDGRQWATRPVRTSGQ